MRKYNQKKFPAADNGEGENIPNNNTTIISHHMNASVQETLFNLNDYCDGCGSNDRVYALRVADLLVRYIEAEGIGTLEEALRSYGVTPPSNVSLNSTHALAPKIALKTGRIVKTGGILHADAPQAHGGLIRQYRRAAL